MDADHPIDPAVRAQVLEQLAQIEQRENVHILYACESGSRGWGFASSDSDYDIRFIFVRPLDQYLRLYPPRDVIEVVPGPVFDVNGWDLKKALLLLAKGNATMLEWLSSPVVYRAEGEFLAQMHAAAVSVYRPQRLFHHYAAMARGNYREYLQGEVVRAKKYLYVLRPVLAALWVTQRMDAPHMSFESLVEAMVADPVVKADIADLLVMKRAAGEQEYFPRRAVLNRFLEETFARLGEVGMPAAGDVDLNVLESVFLGFVKVSEFLHDGVGRVDLTNREPVGDALQLETLTLYCAGKISGSEAKANLGCDTRGLIALVAQHGLRLPHVPQEEAEKMARGALHRLGLNPK